MSTVNNMQIQDDEGNVFHPETSIEQIVGENGTQVFPGGKPGNMESSNMAVAFEEAKTRENIKSGEKHRVLFGKIQKFFTDLKAVAFSGKYGDLSERPTLGGAAGYKVADNDTTNNSEFLTTARVAYEHGLEIDALSRDLSSALGYRAVGFDLNTLTTAIVWGEKFTNAPTNGYFMVISAGDHNTSIQLAQSLNNAQEMWHRSCGAGNWNAWTKKNGRSGTIAGAGAYWKDPPAGQYREWATGCVRWDGDNLVVTVEDDYEQGHLKVGTVVGKKGDTPNWGDKAGGLLVLKY